MHPPISVVIIAGAEERNIRDCLESVRWADEIVVLHSMNTDATAGIAREFTDRVVFRAFDTFSAQREHALALAAHDWVFALDADERMLPELRAEIEARLPEAGPVAGFFVPRRNYFLGRWMRHGGWYPDMQLRLFRKSMTRVTQRLVHEGYVVDGLTASLVHPMDHHTDPTMYHHLIKNVEYTRLEALERRKRVRPRDLLLHPIGAFLQAWIMRKGWKDGTHGLAAALIHAAYNLQQYLFMWEAGEKRE